MSLSEVDAPFEKLIYMGTNGLALLRPFDTFFEGGIGVVQPGSRPGPDAADLAISILESTDPITVGQAYTYTITVANMGPAAANGVVVTNILPAPGVTATNTSQGTIEVRGGRAIFRLGALPAGQSAWMQVSVLPSSGTRALTTTATVNADEPDLDDTNNTAGECTRQLEPGSADVFRQTPLAGQDAVFDRRSGKCLVTVSGARGCQGNRLHFLDAATSRDEAAYYVGSEPNLIAVSEDGAWAYIALDGPTTNVVRFDMTLKVVDLQFSAGGRVMGLAMLPGQADSVLVLTASGMTVFDHGVPRPARADGGGYVGQFTFASPTNLFVLGGDAVLRELVVDAQGLQPTGRQSAPILGVYGELHFMNGKLFSGAGQVLDTSNMSLVANLNFGALAAAWADSPGGRVYFATDAGGTVGVRAIEEATLIQVASLLIPALAPSAPVIFPIEGGIALRTSSQVVFAESDFFTPGEKADLEIRLEMPATPVMVGSEFSAAFSVLNHGPGIATNSVVEVDLPEEIAFVSADSPNVTYEPDKLILRWTSDSIGVGSEKRINLTLVVAKAGLLSLRARVASLNLDPLTANNISMAPLSSEFVSGPDTAFLCKLVAAGLAWDPTRQCLWATAVAQPPDNTNSLVRIDPLTGRTARVAPIGPVPGKVSISEDGRFAYLFENSGTAIRRVDLAQDDANLLISLNYQASDFLIVPGNSRAVLVAAGDTVVYDDGVPRPAVAQPQTTLAVSEDGSMIFAVGYYLDRIVIDASGPQITSRFYHGSLVSRLFVDSGYVITRDGRALDPADGRWIWTLADLPMNAEYLPELAASRLYTFDGNLVAVFDARTSHRVGVIPLPDAPAAPTWLLRWGDDGLAFRGEKSIFVVRSSLVPNGPADDLSLDLDEVSRQASGAGEQIHYRLTAVNKGPADAANTRVTIALPHESELPAITVEGGDYVRVGDVIECRLGLLDMQATRAIDLTINLPQGVWPLTASVNAAVRDSQSQDNYAASLAAVRLAFPRDQAEVLILACNDMTFNTFDQRLYVATGRNAPPGLACSVVTVNPLNGHVGKPVYVGSEPNKLALSDDGRYLYVALAPSGRVRRLNLTTGAFGQDFLVPHSQRYVLDMAVQQGRPDAVAVSVYEYTTVPSDQGAFLAIGGALQSGQLGSMTIAFLEPAQGFFYGYGAAGLVTVGIWDGLVLGGSVGVPLEGWFDFKYQRGLIFMYSGRVIDPANHRMVAVHEDRTWNSVAAADPTANLYYYLQNGVLHAYNLDDHALRGSATIGNAPWSVDNLSRWGVDGFAARNTATVCLFRSSLAETKAGADSDGDGLPDSWEVASGTNPNIPDADSDPDHDGLSNQAEYVLGTDPLDPASGPRLEVLSTGAGSWKISFTMAPNLDYAVVYADTIDSTNWRVLTSLPARPSAGLAEVPIEPGSGPAARFYRIAIPGLR